MKERNAAPYSADHVSGMAALRRMAKEMKKMTFGIIFILVLGILVFAGCVSFSKSGINVDDAINEAALDEYETLIAKAIKEEVTDKNGEVVTNEAGEAITEMKLVEEMTVPVTNAAGETVTNAAGEQETETVYVAKDSGKIVDGKVEDATVYQNKKTGEVVATTAAPPATTKKADSGKSNNGKSNTTSKSSDTTAKSNNTTAKSGGQTTTLPANELNTTVPAQPANPTANEFDYLKSGNFYIQGTMTDSSGQQLPLEMAVTDNSIYMLSNFEGAAIGMLINDGTTYMIYPAEKSYLELSATVLKAMGMSTDDLISSADLDYSQYDFAKADSTLTENVNGANCTVYVYNNSSGSIRFFMNGNKLVRFATYNSDGTPDVINDVGYITNKVPADKINPPSDYKEYKGLTGMFSFISLLSGVVGEE